MRKTVPVESDRLFVFLRGGVAHAYRAKPPVPKHYNGQCGIDCAGSTVGVRDRKPVVDSGCAALRRGEGNRHQGGRRSPINVQLGATFRTEWPRGSTQMRLL